MIDAKDFEHAARALEAAGFKGAAGPIVETAIRRSTAVIQGNVKAKARRHRKTGRLERNVSVRQTGDGLDFEARVHAGGRVAHLITGGTSPHEIAPVRSKAIAMTTGGALVGFAASVRHPGTRPDPFVAAGVDASRRDVQTIVNRSAQELARELTKRMTRRR